MKNAVPTLGLRRSPSPPHHLRPSCRLDWFILHYCVRNRTISTMEFLLHYGHHDQKRGRWDCSECKWIFIAILPHKSLGQFPHCCSFLWSSRLGAQDVLKGFFHQLHTRFDHQPDTVEFEWVSWQGRVLAAGIAMIVWLNKDGESENEIFVIRQRMEQMWTRWWLAEETEMLHTIRWCSDFSNELII